MAVAPDETAALLAHALSSLEAGDTASALDQLQTLLAAAPRLVAGHLALCQCLLHRGDGTGASTAAREAVRLAPLSWEAHGQLAQAQLSTGAFSEALDACDMALRFNRRSSFLHQLRASALTGACRLDDALAAAKTALELTPDDPRAWLAMVTIQQDMTRHASALQTLDEMQLRWPGHAEARWRGSFSLLALGRLREGFSAYEARFDVSSRYSRPVSFQQPRWDGSSDLSGKTVLVHCEQGLGDTLQFCRYASLLAERGARVVVVTRPALSSLLSTLEGVSDVLVFGDPLPPADFHAGFMSLPHLMGTEIDTAPAPHRYLAPPPGKIALWEGRLASFLRPRVGLAWRGNPGHGNDRNRSLDLGQLLQAMPTGLTCVALQNDTSDEERRLLASRPDTFEFASDLGDFADTAALCEDMDLIVTVDTSVAHLAGALGRSVIILLPANPDWRWMVDRTDSPWYPSATLLRQSRLGDWSQVLDALPVLVAEHLSKIDAEIQFE